MRDKILQGMAECAWWLAWSEHVEEHGCCDVSVCGVSRHSPDGRKLAYELAEKALAKVEARILAHMPLMNAIELARTWLRENSEPRDHADIMAACNASTICAVLLVAARADAEKDQDPIAAEFEHPTPEAIDLFNDPEYALRFGRCITYDLVGAGVSWSDDHAEIPWPRMYDSFTDELNMHAEETCDEKDEDEEKPSGYTDCKCRDCFNVALDGGFCNECEDAGCEEDSECQADGAYGVEEDAP
ncbi:MAG: hypothetical protein E6Q36_01230 [Chryseobacterium sp.]|nr:MAG: hypothetical protein E6Q36_01230 [Chryseobacterium sp.]